MTDDDNEWVADINVMPFGEVATVQRVSVSVLPEIIDAVTEHQSYVLDLVTVTVADATEGNFDDPQEIVLLINENSAAMLIGQLLFAAGDRRQHIAALANHIVSDMDIHLCPPEAILAPRPTQREV